MGTPVVVTRADLLDWYPQASPEFRPTHRVCVRDPNTKRILRSDLVCLEACKGPVDFCYNPTDSEPVYAVLDTGTWQCLEVHGLIEVRQVLYREKYIPPKHRQGHVYFLEAGPGGPIKIGWSQNIPRRIGELQTANAQKLKLLGTIPGTLEDEASIHARFSHLRMEAEWFKNSWEIKEFVRKPR